MELVDSIGIFDARNLPPAGSTELDAYGTTELEHLTDHFALFDRAIDGFPAVDEEHAAAEWVLLRSLMSTSYRHMNLADFAASFSTVIMPLHFLTLLC